MSDVLMYCTAFCSYCVRAEQLLTRKGVAITKIQVDNDPLLWEEMENKTGRQTVPQIYIGKYHVGGYDDMAELDMEGKLDELLEPILKNS
ncbi:MAG: glutaredoxin 3 [Gammaproteobacteria bacterium]